MRRVTFPLLGLLAAACSLAFPIQRANETDGGGDSGADAPALPNLIPDGDMEPAGDCVGWVGYRTTSVTRSTPAAGGSAACRVCTVANQSGWLRPAPSSKSTTIYSNGKQGKTYVMRAQVQALGAADSLSPRIYEWTGSTFNDLSVGGSQSVPSGTYSTLETSHMLVADASLAIGVFFQAGPARCFLVDDLRLEERP